jgi:hypothetical protein
MPTGSISCCCWCYCCPPALCLQVFITPMPLLRLMAACGMPHLKNLDEAVAIMRSAMLDVIQVGFEAAGFTGFSGFLVGFESKVAVHERVDCLLVCSPAWRARLSIGLCALACLRRTTHVLAYLLQLRVSCGSQERRVALSEGRAVPTGRPARLSVCLCAHLPAVLSTHSIACLLRNIDLHTTVCRLFHRSGVWLWLRAGLSHRTCWVCC